MTLKTAVLRVLLTSALVLCVLAATDFIRNGGAGPFGRLRAGQANVTLMAEEAEEPTDADRFYDVFGWYPDRISGAEVTRQLGELARHCEKTKKLDAVQLGLARRLHNGLPPSLQPTEAELREQFAEDFAQIRAKVQKASGEFSRAQDLARRFGFRVPPAPTMLPLPIQVQSFRLAAPAKVGVFYFY